MWKVVFLVILVAYQPLDGRKSSGGGGGRGMSAGRQSGPQGGGFGGQPSGGGFQGQRPPPQQPHYPPPGGGGFGGQQPGHFGGGPAGGFNQRPGGFGGGHSNFGSGSGPGSMSRGSVFKTALAGAALGAVGGLVTYELGKAVLHSFDRPFQHDNKNYYWDQEHYKGQPGTIMCSMPLQQLINSAPATTTTLAPAAPVEGAPTTTPSPDQLLSQVVYPNGTRPKEIVWSCKQGAEVCCGTDCCPAPLNQQQQPQNAGSRSGGHSIGGIIFGIIIVLLLMCCCCGLLIYKFCRSAFDFIMPSNSQPNNNTYYDDSKYGPADNYNQQQQYSQGNYGQASQQQSYPMQPYPQQGYQPPNQYPSYPPPPQKY